VMTGKEMEECEVPDKLTMLSYLSQIYDTFRGEIPHIKHPKLEEPEEKETHAPPSRISQLRSLTPTQKANLLGRIASHHHHHHHHAKPIQIRKPPSVVSSPVVATPERKVETLRRQRKRRSTDKERPANISDQEARLLNEAKKGAIDENFSGRIKNLEEKLKGTITDKKPKDLRRAIGKIEKTDWNVKEIEKKILENKMGRGVKHERPEKVPKWSRVQLLSIFNSIEKAMTKRLQINMPDIDLSLKHYDKKLKETSLVQMGPRGNNKVSAIAEQLAGRNQEPEKPAIQRSNSKPALFLPSQGGSESCHFCGKRVYLMKG
ncbi:hypothetical protein L9F63_027000, partial [Diploptera punctata]